MPMAFLERLLKYRWTLSLLILAVFPFSMRGAVKAFQGISNRIVDWMPDEFQATQDYYRFFGLFGSDELLMISWDGCTLVDQRIDFLRDALLAPVETSEGQRPLFRQVITGPDVLDFYQSEPLAMDREEALERMGGWVVSQDHQLTCMIALISDPEKADRHAAVAHVLDSANRVPGLSSDSVHIAGPTMESVAIDRASQSRLLWLNFASFSICLLIMMVCLKAFRAAIVVLMIALFNEQLSMALIYYCGTQMNSILLLTANLTFVMTISICIHLVNYYRDALKASSPEKAPLRACQAALQPTMLATLTTALGLVSLTASQIKPITQFGAYSAVSVILAMGIAIVYTTLHFSIWPLRLSTRATRIVESVESTSGSLERWVGLVRLARWPVILVTLVVLVTGYFGVRRLRTSVGLKELVSPKSSVVQDYVWLEQNIGPLNPIEIVLAMSPLDEAATEREKAKATLAQFRTVTALHKVLAETYRDCAVISSASFAPDPPPEGKGGIRQITARAAFRQKLSRSQDSLSELGYLLAAPEHDYWRITLRCPAMADVDYGELLGDVHATIKATLDSSTRTQPAEVIVCGGVPLVYQAQQQLLEDLVQSFALAFALVAMTLMLLFRSILCGLVCMVPNLLPSALVFGIMGWRGTPVEIGAILTASAALGIAVDDSLHFITWFRRKVGDGAAVRDAVRFAYRRCAAAMVQTTLICGFGLVVFALSPFAPIARFGWCMFALLMAALLADLVVLPAILLSPLGRFFLPSGASTRPSSLRGFALRVAGPREFVITLVVNTIIAVWVFHGARVVPLVGGLSLLTYFGPMSFLLPAVTTFFGYFSGVMERRSGRVAPPWPDGGRWMGAAILAGLLRGCCFCLGGVAILYSLHALFPDMVMSKWMAIGTIGLTAGMLGYGLHAWAAVRSGRLMRNRTDQNGG